MEMTPEQWGRVKELYELALEHAAGERERFLQDQPGEIVVLQEVRRLLEETGVGTFLSTPAYVDRRFEAKDVPHQLANGEVLVGRFRIVHFIAAGGMGEVYKAEDVLLERAVVVKLLPKDLSADREALARFRYEAKAASPLNHPNICTVYDFGEDSGRAFIAMEYLEGETLSTRIKQGRLAVNEALEIAIAMTRALGAAHRRGIIHRDLKPGNIMLTENGAKLLDFGVAKYVTQVTSGEETTISFVGHTQMAGTLSYMSPEQLQGKELDGRSDIFTLGAVLYEMLTGRRAFRRHSGRTALVDTQEPPSMRQIVPDVPEKLEAVVRRCMRWQPAKRYASVSAVEQELEDCYSLVSPAFSRIGLTGLIHGIRRPKFAVPILGSVRHTWYAQVGVKSLAFVLLLGLCLIGAILLSNRSSRFPSAATQLQHQQITFVGNAYDPAISPDGKTVAYKQQEFGGEQKLMIQPTRGGPSLELLHGEGIHPAVWSPDGSQLAIKYAASQGGDDPSTFLVPRLGGPFRKITTDGSPRCWSMDGSSLLLAPQSPGGANWTNTVTGAVKKISLPPYQILGRIDCSRSGRLVAEVTTGQRHQIWTTNPDGVEPRKLLETGGEVMTSPRWAPKGNSFYYLLSHGDTTDLMKDSLSHPSSPVVLASGLEFGEAFSLSADASILAYTRARLSSNLWLAELRPGSDTAPVLTRQLTSGTFQQSDPSVSPDGQWIAFLIGTNTRKNIYKMRIDGTQVRQVTFGNPVWCSSPVWSPDGRQIAFVGDPGGLPKVWVVNADGTAAHPLDKTDPSDTNQLIAWNPSPTVIYQQKGLQNLRRVDVATQEESAVLAKDSEGWLVSPPILSPDGKNVAILWNRDPQQGIWILSLTTGAETLVFPGPYTPFGWSPDGRSLYAISAKSLQRQILRIDLKQPSHAVTLITTDLPLWRFAGAITPDGGKIIFGLVEERSDVWLMRNFDLDNSGR